MSSSPSVTIRLLRLARPQLGLLAIATCSLLISSGLSLAYPQAVRWMVDLVVEGNDRALLNQVAVLLVLMFLVQSVFTMLRAWLFTVAGERVVRDLRIRLYAAIVHQDMAFFDTGRTGELTNRLASDTTVLQNTVTVNLSMGLRYLIGALADGLIVLDVREFGIACIGCGACGCCRLCITWTGDSETVETDAGCACGIHRRCRRNVCWYPNGAYLCT